MAFIAAPEELCKVFSFKRKIGKKKIPIEHIEGRRTLEDLYAGCSLSYQDQSSLKEKYRCEFLSFEKERFFTKGTTLKENKIPKEERVIDFQKVRDKIFPQGKLFQKGDLIVSKNVGLSKREIPFLKKAGINEVLVSEKPRIFFLSSQLNQQKKTILECLFQKFEIEGKIIETSNIFQKIKILAMEEEIDFFLVNDLKEEKNNIVSLTQEKSWIEEYPIGLCKVEGKTVFHIGEKDPAFTSSLIWIFQQFLSLKEKKEGPVKVLLGMDLSPEIYQESILMNFKCEKGYIVAYPLLEKEQKGEALKKVKAIFSLNGKRAERGEWIEVLRL